MRRKSLAAAECPVARALDVIGDWWSLLIIRDTHRGMRRFGEFQKSLGVSKNILTQRLRALEAQGILDCMPASDGSAYHDYVLTEKGRALFTIIVALREWGTEYCFPDGRCGTILVDRRNGRPIRKLAIQADDGRLLKAGDTIMLPSL